MSKKELKITEEQLKVLKAQQVSKANIVTDIGVVEAQKHELLHALANVMDKQKELAKELEEQYGKINVNLEDGSYEVVEVEEEAVEEEK
jgi:hypothetical protein|tara:strand:- start:281 stop:547 length:267 start_codon:yes stop_codon:yes gene_type:complete